ncbi:hypothetical protein [Nostoc sp. WHI]|uniref:hypothetical protein n=1 Tax=Nostoc sp. WHI TaxID=2650611 RepID=UPI0018C74A2E|nr:hypothetical protein [Nostoc sp. WHI]MBG1267745.1 hypothetical protein [Nostoc sp. WHI]
MNRADFEAFGAQLGLESSAKITDTEKDKLVSGCSKPRPGRASKQLSDGSNFSSFFSTAKMGEVTTAGYDILDEEIVLKVSSGGAGGGS